MLQVKNKERMIQHDDKRPVHVIINPLSGYGGHKLMRADLRNEIRSAGMDVVEYTTRCAGDATRYAASIVGQASGVVVWGGDGTVNEVANALVGTELPILPCPAGTENLLAKELGVPQKPEIIARILRTGQVVNCDVGVINGRNFLMVIGIGFDGEVVHRVAAERTGHISHLSYFWPIWRTLWEHRFPRMRVVADGQEVFNGQGAAFLGNIARYATGLRICRDAQFTDGLLDLVIFPCTSQAELLYYASWTALRKHPEKGKCVYRQAKTIQFETDSPVPTQVDGDVGPDTPLNVSLAPGKLKLIVPLKK